jgi:hypothetical protein
MFNVGDVVKFGKSGTVEYTITAQDSTGHVDLKDTVNSRKRSGVVVTRLTLITAFEKEVQPTSYQIAILSGVQGLAHVFGGATLNNKFIARRAKNKVAKQTRKSNR